MHTHRLILSGLLALLAAACTFDAGGLSAGDGSGARDQSLSDHTTPSEARPVDVAPPGPDLLSPDASPHDATPHDATPPHDVTPPHDSLQPDSTPGPRIIEAESYSNHASLDSTHSWVHRNDMAGYSGVGFMQAVPYSPYVACTTNLATCGARLDYSFSLSVPATHLHVCVHAQDTSRDSFHWLLDSGSPKTAAWSTYNAWVYVSVPATLGAGAHTLSIWMREPEARIDLIVISSSAKPPAKP